MQGYLSLVLHAHLPFVRHPEHERFLEETWLFEAITETYVPLLQLLESWRRDGIDACLTLTLSPTLCAMLLDPLLQERYARHLNDLIALAEKEVLRTRWEPPFHELASFYHDRFRAIRDAYLACDGDLVGAFRKLQRPRTAGNHHQRCHPCLAAAPCRPPAVNASANSRCSRPLPRLFWPRSARHLAAGMRLCRGRGNRLEGGRHWLVHHRHPRNPARAPAAALCRVCTRPHPQRHCRVRPRPRFRQTSLESP